jgi:hypothetical protein
MFPFDSKHVYVTQLTDYLREGPNKIALSRNDSYFLLGYQNCQEEISGTGGIFFIFSSLLSIRLSRNTYFTELIFESAAFYVFLF